MFKIGDYIRSVFYEDGESALVLEILNPHDWWSRGLGRYPDHVFRVLKDTGEITVWDVFQYPDEEPEYKVLIA